MRALAGVLALAVGAACTGAPAFQFEPADAIATQPHSEWLSIGSPSTPPPGEYRFARVFADGTADVRELFTSNGPGPWLSLTGRVRVPQSAAREALTATGTPPFMADDPRGPCVTAVDSASTKWQGCAYSTIAAHMLAQTPRLKMPDVATSCELRVCQVRLTREVSPVRHERYGTIQQDRLLDHTGAFWCAAPDPQGSGQIVTLRVERIRISEPDALRVFRWVMGSLDFDTSANQSSPGSDVDRVMVRRRGGNWIQLSESEAMGIRERWDLLASKLPAECRSTR